MGAWGLRGRDLEVACCFRGCPTVVHRDSWGRRETYYPEGDGELDKIARSDLLLNSDEMEEVEVLSDNYASAGERHSAEILT